MWTVCEWLRFAVETPPISLKVMLGDKLLGIFNLFLTCIDRFCTTLSQLFCC